MREVEVLDGSGGLEDLEGSEGSETRSPMARGYRAKSDWSILWVFVSAVNVRAESNERLARGGEEDKKKNTQWSLRILD